MREETVVRVHAGEGVVLLTEAEAAAELRVSLSTLRRRRKEDGLPHVRLGRRVLYRWDELVQCLTESCPATKRSTSPSASADK